MKNLNTTSIYVLSIIGLLCCCFGGLGVILSGSALFIADKKIKDAALHPEDYEGDLNAIKTAKTVALVITVINSFFLIYNIYDLATGGFEERQKMIDDFIEGYKEGFGNAN